MLLKNNLWGLNSVAFRLAWMYAVISTVSLIAVMLVSYWALESTLQNRMDEGLASEIVEYQSLLKLQDMSVIKDVLTREAVSEGTHSVFFRILDQNSTILFTTDMRSWQDVAINPQHLLAANGNTPIFDTLESHSRDHPVRIIYGAVSPEMILQIGESTESNVLILKHFQRIFSLGAIALVLFSVIAGSIMSRQALSGVQRVTEAVKEVAIGDFDRRVPVSTRNDEIDTLAIAFNDMAEKIEILIRELKEVTDDIAHDLRTPISRMRIAAEMSLTHKAHTSEEENVSGHILEECDMLLELINTMLEISQTDSGIKSISFEELDISDLSEDVCELFQPVAEDKNVHLTFSGSGGILVAGEQRKLKRAIAHIIDNAIKFTASGGNIEVVCKSKGNQAHITVQDSGVGIPQEELEKVFDRFYRIDKSRSENGNGLGLSLARSIVNAHKGELTLTSELGQGSTLCMVLPESNRE